MSDLSKILAEALEAGVEVRQYCSFNCTNEATGDITIVDNGMNISLPVCQECAGSIIGRRQVKGLDTVIEK